MLGSSAAFRLSLKMKGGRNMKVTLQKQATVQAAVQATVQPVTQTVAQSTVALAIAQSMNEIMNVENDCGVLRSSTH